MVFVAAMLAACGGSNPGSGSAKVAPDATKLTTAIRGVMAKASIPGAIVGVWRKGDQPYVQAFGVRDTQTRQPMATDLYMRIGSETKTFTITALLQLVDQGKVGLDDPIGKFITGVPDGNVVTIRQLAEMRSGLASYTANPAFVAKLQAHPRAPWTPQELLSYAFSQPALFAPGSSFNYSNTNTVLLGLVVEKLSGQALHTYIEQHILVPEHLNHTSFPTDASFPTPNAHGYTRQTPDGQTADATDWNPSWGWAAGAMISDLSDLHAWAKILATGGLLKPATQVEREKFLTAQGMGTAGYGLGMFSVGGWIGHNGSLPGYQTAAVYLPAQQATMVVLVNSDTPYQGSPLSTLLGDAITQVISPGHIYTFPAAPAPAAAPAT
jgi:D-alanyl-D-alanine carboxypeptidase